MKKVGLGKLEKNSFLILHFCGEGYFVTKTIFEIRIEFSTFDTLRDLFQEKKFSSQKGNFSHISKQKEKKRETPQNKKCLFLK
jgi:hypothetical protein